MDGATLVYVPAGKFAMGSTVANDEKPLHAIELDAFWIGLTEVTNEQYAQCVAAGACTAPDNDLADDPAYADHPVVNIDWFQAAEYAAWAGGRLPTEAEWEKAARGTDARPFPWGGQTPDNTFLNFNMSAGTTEAVGAYPAGASPYGLLDMAGNVEEWVADWYAGDYYVASPVENPAGPDEGVFRAARGGSFNSNPNLVRASVRGKALPNTGYPSVGLRIVVDP